MHRDIKPENVLLGEGHARVADFGVARALESASGSQLTEAGLSVGTPAYMSPEQASGGPVDGRCDVYSLGCVVYEMLAGEPPFTGPTAQVIIAKRLSGEVPRVRLLRPAVPEATEQAITRALAPVAADRFSSAAEFAQALAAAAPAAPGLPSTVPAPHPPARALRQRARVIGALAGIALILGAAVGILWRGHRPVSGTAPPDGGTKRLAVLPFESLGDTSGAYFAEGMAAEIRGMLANLPGLTVIASTSSNQYRHTTKTPRQIAQELGVRYLLVGHVQWDKGAGSAGRVRVSPELVEATTGATTWQEPFDAALTDVFQVQADVARRVAEALNVALGTSERRALAERPTANLVAYDAFLQGEAASQGLSVTDAPSLRRAIGFYEQAVALDSVFSPAWAQLARARAILYYLRTPSAASGEGVRVAAARAQALAPGRLQSQLAWASYLFSVREDYAGALQAYETGLRQAPNDADLLTVAGTVEYISGRWEAGVQHLERAQALDPRAVRTPVSLAFALLALRRWGEARRAADQALALAPTHLGAVQTKVETYLGQGDLAGAQAVLRAASRLVEPAALVAYVTTYSNLSWVLDSSQQALLLHLPPATFDDDRGSRGLAFAEAYALRDDRPRVRLYADSAIYLLVGEPEKALDQLAPLLTIPYSLSPGRLRIDPTWDALRGNPRFERLVAGK